MKKGRKYNLYGAFKHKSDAVKKEHEGKNRFIVERSIKGKKRYVVLKER